MSRRVTYHLAGVKGWWTLWRENDTQPVLQAGRKDAILAQARALARQDGARLLIYAVGGGVLSERVYRGDGA